MSTALLAVVEEETREVFQGVGLSGEVVFYALSFVAIAVFAWGWWLRIRKYRKGRPAPETNGSRRDRSFLAALGQLASNSTIARKDRPVGVAHFLIFWGFITLFMGTVILTIDVDVVRLATREIGGQERSFFQGVFYLVYSVILDTMGLAALLGIFYMGVRRRRKPPQLDYARVDVPPEAYSRRQFERGDVLFLGLFVLILITGFLEEGFRIRASGFPDFEIWSPVGWVVARAASGLGIDASASDTTRLVFWWIHAVLALGFVAYIPYSKAMHMLTDAADVVTHDPSSARRLPRPATGATHLGYVGLSDFTRRQLLELDSCTKCGRCHVVCPANLSGAPLSPRDLILDLREWAEINGGSRSVLDHEDRPEPTGPLTRDGAVAGDVIRADTLWSCTTCMACFETCPVGIEHVPTIVELRRSLVEEGDMEASLQGALQNLAQKGNSFGKSARQAARWTKGLEFQIPDAREQPVRYLWFVGDHAAFDDRMQETTRILATVLHDAGIDFGILYDAERSAGNDVRRVGEEGLFEMLVEQNIEAMAGAEFSEIFTTDPHSLNTLRNEYPDHGLDKPVRHYTELLAELLASRTLAVEPLGRRVTYHDPCYLARYNNLTRAPREVLGLLGCELVEMPRNRENTYCCGAGGGRIWMDDSGLSERPSENRIREAVGCDVDAFVVACPKDFAMYSDAVKTTGHDDQLAVVDIVQLVEAAIRTRTPATAATGGA